MKVADRRPKRKKVVLIPDNPGVPHGKPVGTSLDEHKDEIEVFYLPRYGLELNPDERLNADLKHAIGRGKTASRPRQDHPPCPPVQGGLNWVESLPARPSGRRLPPQGVRCRSGAALGRPGRTHRPRDPAERTPSTINVSLSVAGSAPVVRTVSPPAAIGGNPH